VRVWLVLVACLVGAGCVQVNFHRASGRTQQHAVCII